MVVVLDALEVDVELVPVSFAEPDAGAEYPSLYQPPPLRTKDVRDTFR